MIFLQALRNEDSLSLQTGSSIIIFIIILFLIYLTNFYSFLLFHTIAELFSIAIAFGVFAIGWNTRKNIENSLFLILGVSLAFIGLLDLVHTLAYKGLDIFRGYDANLPTQLWIAARYLQAGSFFIAVMLFNKKINPNQLVIFYTIVVCVLLLLIFSEIFPVCYIEGHGLTPFKIVSEYVIIAILLGVIIKLYRLRKEFDPLMFYLIVFSNISTIIAELAFTFYIGVTDVSNLIGHIFKILSFYLIYLAIIQKGLEDPLNTLFSKLKHSEEILATKAEDLESAYSLIKESEEKFRLTFENASDALIWADANTGTILNCNHAAEILLERNKEEIIGMDQTYLHPTEKREIYKKMFRDRVESEELYSNEAEVITKSGKIIPVTISASNIVISGELIIQGIFHDIRERKKAEQKLKNLVSTVSHELRTPLTVLNMSMDLYKQQKNSMTPELQNKIIETWDRNITLLKDLSENILNISRIDEKKIELELNKFKLLNIIMDIVVFLTPFCKQKKVRINIDIDKNIELKGDIKRIDQVFRIILDNAIKYSYENTTIEINAIDKYRRNFDSANKSEGILIQFKNYGIGISKEDLPHIFERFYRASNAGEISGTGLGLSIAKSIVQLHQGEIYIESELGKSTTFSIFFPRLNKI
ncbi:MAG: MASE3 domain-containing protein [Promethearchaeota archaeon]